MARCRGVVVAQLDQVVARLHPQASAMHGHTHNTYACTVLVALCRGGTTAQPSATPSTPRRALRSCEWSMKALHMGCLLGPCLRFNMSPGWPCGPPIAPAAGDWARPGTSKQCCRACWDATLIIATHFLLVELLPACPCDATQCDANLLCGMAQRGADHAPVHGEACTWWVLRPMHALPIHSCLPSGAAPSCLPCVQQYRYRVSGRSACCCAQRAARGRVLPQPPSHLANDLPLHHVQQLQSML